MAEELQHLIERIRKEGVESGEKAADSLVAEAKNLDRVELLRYNRSAGAKYGLLGEEYKPSFDTEREPNMDLSIFEKYGIKAVAL